MSSTGPALHLGIHSSGKRGLGGSEGIAAHPSPSVGWQFPLLDIGLFLVAS